MRSNPVVSPHRALLAPISALAFLLPGMPATLSAVELDFKKHVYPIFESKCIKCHRAAFIKAGKTEKPKGGLRLDSAQGILRGGSEGKVLYPGNIARSSLYELAALPADDEDRMPPPGKADALTKRELAILKKWIEDGAKFGSWTGTGPAIASSSKGRTPSPTRGGRAAPLTQDQLEKLRQAGATVTPIVVDSPMISVEFATEAGSIGDKNLEAVADVGTNVVELNLARTKISDEGLAVVAGMPNLERLNLANTGITNKGLEHLSGLRALTHLNLWGTSISDKGVTHLTKLGRMERLYLWKTKVDEDGYELLKNSMRKARIHWEEPD